MNALKLAAGSSQRDTVYQSMGADAAAAGDFKAAGAHYGRIVGGKPPFEELALVLVESGDPEALQIFLQTKLQVLVTGLASGWALQQNVRIGLGMRGDAILWQQFVHCSVVNV